MIIKSNIQKIKVIKTILIIGLFLFFVAHYGCSDGKNQQFDNDRIVALIDRDQITLEELKFFISKNKINTHNRYQTNFNKAAIENIWENISDDKNRAKTRKDIAIIESILTKTQLILTREFGLIEDVSYNVFLKTWRNENKRRREAKKRGEIIYGPVKFSKKAYFNYYFSNLVIDLKRELAGNAFPIDNNILQKFYDKFKNSYYTNRDTMVVKVVSFNENDSSKTKAQARIIRKLIKKNKFETLSNKYKNLEISKIDFTKVISDERDELLYFFEKKSENMEVGEVSKILEFQDNIYVIKCIQKRKGSSIPFNHIKSTIRSDYIDKKYNEILTEKIKKSDIYLNYAVYKNID